ncbi:unnamed protein product [Clonostachys rosea]|uniref:NACHT domain-containing protein n=1 Tax=Bionectria ochroleuca TaxID=29856 RepID=A0ABY6TQU5_BIOOC|nr:unnamed protein product [Clonostachys rosea]
MAHSSDLSGDALERDSWVQDKLAAQDPELQLKRLHNPVANTYEWIFKEQAFTSWIGGAGPSILWINGIAGMGKSTMLGGIVEAIRSKNIATGSDPKVAYFFCNDADPNFGTTDAILRRLVFLLMDTDIVPTEKIARLLTKLRNKHHFDSASVKDLFLVLLDAFKEAKKTLFLVVDAVDECADFSTHLFELISKTMKESTSFQLRWLISSRESTNITQRICLDGRLFKLELRKDNEQLQEAVTHYITSRVRSMNIRDKARQKVIECLLKRAQGWFLLARLDCDRIQALPEHRIVKEMNGPDLNLDHLYENAVARAQKSTLEKLGYLAATHTRGLDSILMLAADSHRTLSLNAIKVIWDLESKDHDTYLASLIENSGLLALKGKKVTFVHSSAKEYLQRRHYPQAARIHHDTALRLLQIMRSELQSDVGKLVRRNGLDLGYGPAEIERYANKEQWEQSQDTLQYACIEWMRHLERAYSLNIAVVDDPSTVELVFGLLTERFYPWLAAVSLFEGYPEIMKRVRHLEDILARSIIHSRGSLRQKGKRRELYGLVREARQFICFNWASIQDAPLQATSSAATFVPTKSRFWKRSHSLRNPPPPLRIRRIWGEDDDWDACVLSIVVEQKFVAEEVSFTPRGDSVILDWRTGQEIRFSNVNRGMGILLPHCQRQVVSGGYGESYPRILDDSVIETSGMDKSEFRSYSHCRKYFIQKDVNSTITIMKDKKQGDDKKVYEYQDAEVESACISGNGKLICSLRTDGSARVEKLDQLDGTKKLVEKFHSVDAGVTCALFAPGKNILILGTCNSRILVQKINRSRSKPQPPTLEVTGHSGEISCLAMSLDGKRLASGSHDCTIRLWDMTTDEPRCLAIYHGHFSEVKSVSFSADNRHLVSVGLKDVRIWELKDRNDLDGPPSFDDSLKSEPKKMFFSPNGNELAILSSDGDLELLDAATGNPIFSKTGCLLDPIPAYSPDGKFLVLPTESSHMLLDARRKSSGDHQYNNGIKPSAFIWSPRGNHLAILLNNGAVQVIGIEHQKHMMLQSEERITDVIFSPCGQHLATQKEQKYCIVFSLKPEGDWFKTHQLNYEVAKEASYSLQQFTKNFQRLVVIKLESDREEIHIWSLDPINSKIIHRVEDCFWKVRLVALSSDNGFVAWTDSNKKLEIQEIPGQENDRKEALLPPGQDMISMYSDHHITRLEFIGRPSDPASILQVGGAKLNLRELCDRYWDTCELWLNSIILNRTGLSEDCDYHCIYYDSSPVVRIPPTIASRPRASIALKRGLKLAIQNIHGKPSMYLIRGVMTDKTPQQTYRNDPIFDGEDYNWRPEDTKEPEVDGKPEIVDVGMSQDAEALEVDNDEVEDGTLPDADDEQSDGDDEQSDGDDEQSDGDEASLGLFDGDGFDSFDEGEFECFDASSSDSEASEQKPPQPRPSDTPFVAPEDPDAVMEGM